MRARICPIKSEFSWVYERQRLESELAALQSELDRAIDQYLSGESDDSGRIAKARQAFDALSPAMRSAMLALPHGPVPKPQTWNTLRKRIYKRDSGICHVCGNETPWEHYECGHIVDRFIGGPDAPENLLCMCSTCNHLKPVHETREQYEQWRASGAWFAEIAATITSKIFTFSPPD